MNNPISLHEHFTVRFSCHQSEYERALKILEDFKVKIISDSFEFFRPKEEYVHRIVYECNLSNATPIYEAFQKEFNKTKK